MSKKDLVVRCVELVNELIGDFESRGIDYKKSVKKDIKSYLKNGISKRELLKEFEKDFKKDFWKVGEIKFVRSLLR